MNRQVWSWFVTGTDTDVGKTVVSTTLLQAAACRGLTTAGYKPVASGSRLCAGALCNDDALALQAASSLQLRYAQVNPYTFAEATAPHIVSAEAETPIDPRRLSAGLRYLQRRAQWVVVEGAGGWFTPLSLAYGFNSWVASEKLPVILTVGVKLGCINHALLSAHAIESAGLRLAGWVANQVQTPGTRHGEYLNTLHTLLPAPCLGEIPFVPGQDSLARAACLDLSALLP
ncbi:ATP-dependent dethiobiotin synthetase BioD [Edwardsiella ictaluri]|uniref:dethiobiotin synthase n=1 Tax=Edwardsiella ictaluri TaxID=67780 RepID=UPI0005503CBD|nr:dethiobiotin synthase [Edwardsiella ictaluri]AVZ83088.1 ATP-dependent dethiobiotin synthetase BioD [Edwardsiella ictaluri]UCQ46948.1 dethiobiotin synthase [Edwardsiella ictaluri]UCQ50211.1 dethiobiotin synthase [Edwardsiella ictaluri]UYB60889.1 dethiobiotin synthase [Edwardsiella ictaluri]UYB64117.1 dethiobiotin synthase [Edwardsiella ictaluri]